MFPPNPKLLGVNILSENLPLARRPSRHIRWRPKIQRGFVREAMKHKFYRQERAAALVYVREGGASCVYLGDVSARMICASRSTCGQSVKM